MSLECGGPPEADRNGSLADAYARLLDVDGTRPPPLRYADARYRMCLARLVTHYWRHAAWLDDGELLRNSYADRLCASGSHPRPAGSELSTRHRQADSEGTARAQFYIVPGVGHSFGGAMAAHLVDFLDGFARTISDS